MATGAQHSPFLFDSPTTAAGDLAIIQISRDKLVPVQLRGFAGAVDGYAEGDVLNTVFGSFPHSTLIGVPWGSQVRASAVDTGSRGRKRKRGNDVGGTPKQEEAYESKSELPPQQQDDAPEAAPETVTASSGFVHILRPTPELWTMSLPHRTQVVYTPDYSFILQRLHALPGTQLIEAGAGSGSFTHASARAIFSGLPTGPDDPHGKVWSFELDDARFGKIGEELAAHGLEDVVRATHRNVCRDGFLVDGKSPRATAVFLDLPAPWEALPRLSRQRPPKRSAEGTPAEAAETGEEYDAPWVSPLDPDRTAYVCTFSPCIEQVTRTIATLRELGWVDIDMVEISHKKFIVSRERVGTLGGSDPTPRDVNEALARLREVNKRTERYHRPFPRAAAAASKAAVPANSGKGEHNVKDEEGEEDEHPGGADADEEEDAVRRPWRHGRFQARPESEIKTHTSYLTFAVLPREWTDEDEEKALGKWGVHGGRLIGQAADRDTRKRLKAEMHQTRQAKNAKGRA